MPGERSLLEQQYYANKQNAFWHIMFDIFNQGQPLTLYPDKIALLKANRIALWDVFATCQREGSLDSKIKNGVLNDFEMLFKIYPNIKLVLFNGGTSYNSIKKNIAHLNGINYQIMPSTSPAHTMAYQSKLLIWQKLLLSS